MQKYQGIPLTWAALAFFVVSGSWSHGQFVKKLSSADQKIVDAKHESETKISVKQVNQLHLRLLDAWIRSSKGALSLEYGGIVRDSGPKSIALKNLSTKITHSSWIAESYGDPLAWRLVGQGEVLFGFWISVNETARSIGRVNIDGRTMHINLEYTIDDRGIKSTLRQLNGRSISDLLAQLPEADK